MSPINPTTSTTTTHDRVPSATSSTSNTALDKNTFLKLMMVQLQNQDPLQPSDPTQYVSELAQLTTLEQTTNMAQSAAQTASEQNTDGGAAAARPHGHLHRRAGNTLTGTVQKVQFTSSGPTLTINGIDGIDPTSVTRSHELPRS